MISGLCLRLIGQSILQPLQKLDKIAAVRRDAHQPGALFILLDQPHEQPAYEILTWAHPASIETATAKSRQVAAAGSVVGQSLTANSRPSMQQARNWHRVSECCR